MYNGIGNIVSVTKRTGNSTGSTTTFGYDTAQPDRLTSFGGKAITYNDNGGVASYDGWDYVWSKGKLSSIRKSSGGSARAVNPPVFLPTKTYSFTYNALGQRVTSNYTNYLSDDTISSVDTGEAINYTKQFSYDHAGRLIAEVVNGERYGVGAYSETLRYLYDNSSIVGVQYTNGANINDYYFLRNLQGDVIAIYDTNGAKVVSYSYDAWGNCTIDSSTTDYDLAHVNPIRYRGYYYDENTKLYYLNSRYYSPEFRRFISPDDTNYLVPKNVNGCNLYCYCNNDPVMNVDPTGNSWWSNFWNAILSFFTRMQENQVSQDQQNFEMQKNGVEMIGNGVQTCYDNYMFSQELETQSQNATAEFVVGGVKCACQNAEEHLEGCKNAIKEGVSSEGVADWVSNGYGTVGGGGGLCGSWNNFFDRMFDEFGYTSLE